MRYLLALILPLTLYAVEAGPVQVLQVIDGDTVEVAAMLGGTVVPLRVRMLYVDTPEITHETKGDQMAHKAQTITRVMTSLGNITLWAPGKRFERDRYGRILACVLTDHFGDDSEVNNINLCLVQAGLSAYWRKYGQAPEPLHSQLVKAHASAEAKVSGMWSEDGKWMRDKANERTKPFEPIEMD